MSSINTTTTISVGQAWAGVVPKGHHLRIRSKRIVHLVAFDNESRRDRLDDSRTKGNVARMYVTVGSKLISKFNRDLLQIVADNSPPWSHDFLTGMRAEVGVLEAEPETDWSHLARALNAYNVRPDEISTPLNLFSRVTLEEAGKMIVRSDILGYAGEVELRSETDCLVGLCVSSQQPGPVENAEIEVFQADTMN